MFTLELSPCILSASFGLLSCFFIHRYPLRGDTWLVMELFATFLTFFAQRFVAHTGYSNYALIFMSVEHSCLRNLVLVTATVLYRLSPFHPLYHFPGPVFSKVSSFPLLFSTASGKRHTINRAWHDKYGKFVRTGPNTLSINSHVAIGPLYASSSAMDKSDAYSIGDVAGNALFWMRSTKGRGDRRRRWARWFSTQRIHDKHDLMERYTAQLLDCIDRRSDEAGLVDLYRCLQHWAYDMTGELTFGIPGVFEYMKTDGDASFIKGNQQSVKLFEILGEMPTLFHLLWHLPITEEMRLMQQRAELGLRLRESVEEKGDRDDLITYLIDKSVVDGVPLNQDDLRLETSFAVQAGADTTPGTLSIVLFYVITHRNVYLKLQKELDAAFPNPNRHISATALAELPYLQAVLDEGVRFGSLFPASGIPRVVPKGGVVIGDAYIPEGTIVGMPVLAHALSEENFWPHPDAYMPERWLPGGLGPDSQCRKTAILVFGHGPTGCLGRSLALHQMALAVAKLTLAYDLMIDPSVDPQEILAGVQNFRSTTFQPTLTVVAKRRIRT